MSSRITYYLSSIPTIFGQISNWFEIPALLFRKQPIVLKLKNGRFFKVRNVMDVWIVKETCLDRDYEVNGIAITDGWTVIDIGSGIGEFAIMTAKEHPNCQIYAYEPFPESYALLQDNLALNKADNVNAFQIAVGSTSGKMTLATTGEAVQHTTTGSDVSGNATSLIEVQGISFEELFEANNILCCDFLKLDCEGCEFELLLNASPTTLQKINHICMEYHNGFTEYSHTDLVTHLEENGFQVKVSPNPVHDFLGFMHAYR